MILGEYGARGPALWPKAARARQDERNKGRDAIIGRKPEREQQHRRW